MTEQRPHDGPNAIAYHLYKQFKAYLDLSTLTFLDLIPVDDLISMK